MAKIKQGKVIKKSSDKTISVLVERMFQHPLYKKILRRHKKYLVHDQNNECSVGDYIKFQESAPISARKRHSFLEVQWRSAEVKL